MIIFFLCLLLFALCTAVGGLRGIKSFSVLIYNALIILVSLFLFALGVNAFAVMLASSVIFTLLTLIYQNGFSVKTISSLISVIAVLLVMSVIIYYICSNAHISGLNEIQIEEGNNFMNYAVKVNMLDILIVSTVWAALGAIIDTSISISSALNEINSNNSMISTNSLIKSGMLIGKDILGTTINTLTFVGFGEALMLIIFYVENNYTIREILNLKSFFQELSGILISCISCVLIIPITAVVFSLMIKNTKVSTYFERFIKEKQ